MERRLIAAACILLMFASCKMERKTDPYLSWEVYLGDPGRNSYSKLDQINRDNVHRLEVAWTGNVNW